MEEQHKGFKCVFQKTLEIQDQEKDWNKFVKDYEMGLSKEYRKLLHKD